MKLFNIYHVYKNSLKRHFGHTACQANAKLESETGLINHWHNRSMSDEWRMF